MKFILVLIVCVISLVSTASSQFVAFKASEGVNAAKKSADSSITSPKLVGVLTLGDTTSAIQLPFPVKFFDYTNGTSQGWIYFFRGLAKGKTTDTTMSFAVARVGIGIFSVFQAFSFDLGVGAVGAFFAKDSVLPAKFFDSDKMIAAIKSDAEFKKYNVINPDSKAFLIPMGYTPLALQFPSNTPVWSLTFGGPTTNGTLSCEVHVVTGETKCRAIAVGVEEGSTAGTFSISPNPASNYSVISLPQDDFSPTVTLELYTSIGTKIQNFTLSVGMGESIHLPLDGLSNGLYFVKYSAGSRSVVKSLLVQH